MPSRTASRATGPRPLARLRAARAAQEVPSPPDLTARVAAQAARLDARYPAQAPGGTPRVGTPVWQQLGPTTVLHERVDGYDGPIQLNADENGRVRKILVDPRDSNVVYVLYGAGGLWKSTNFHATHPSWSPLTDRLISVSSGSIAFGSSPDTLYLGLGDPFDNRPSLGGLMVKSTDGGATWSRPIPLPAATMVTDIAVDTTARKDIVMIATDNGLFRSTDGGRTYWAIQRGSTGGGSTAVDDRIFFGTTVWSIARTSAGWVVSAGTGGVLDSGNGFVALSSDHGATWAVDDHDGVGFSAGGRATLAVGVPGDSVVYAFQGWAYPDEFYQRDVFRSTDGGWTWTALNTTSTAPLNPTPEEPTVVVASYQAWYDQLIWVDPTDPTRNTVFIGGDLYTAKTTDGGSSWRLMTQWLAAYGLPYLHADEHTATYVPGTKPMLVVGNDGGLATSTDGGASWNFDRNDGITTAAIYGLASSPADPQKILVGTQDTGTLLRKGNSTAFNELLGGDGMVPAIGQANAHTNLGTFEDGGIFRSTYANPNQLSRWDLTRDFDDDAWFYTPLVAASAAADPHSRVFYTYTQHEVLRTTDAGITWTPILSADPSGPPVTRSSPMNLAVDPRSIDGVAVGDYGGLVHITHDGGASWSTSHLLDVPGYGGFNYTLAWAHDSVIYVGSENQAEGAVRVVRSSDGGLTWNPAGAGLPDLPVVKLTPDLSDPSGLTVYAGTWIGVFRTTDGGASWQPFGAGLPHAYVSDLYVAPDGSLVRAGTYGRGVWEVRVHGTR